MKTNSIFGNLLLVSLILTWFFGIGSWGHFFGFLGYGIIPADKPAVSSSISEPENSIQKKPVKNQLKRQQHQASKAGDASGRIHVGDNANLRNRTD